MKFSFLHIILLAGFFPLASSAQLVNNGQVLHLDANSLVYVNDNYQHNSGEVSGDGMLEIRGSWINNSSSPVFEKSSKSTVILSGATQDIKGGISGFYNLSLAGKGNKYLQNDAFILNTLSLQDRVLNIGNNKLSILNTAANAIERTSGFIENGEAGSLTRNTASTGSYLFPLGSTKDNPSYNAFSSTDINPLYRPLYIEPENSEKNTYSANLVNKDPDFQYPRANKEKEIDRISNRYFYVLDHNSGTTKFNAKFLQNKAVDNHAIVALWSAAKSLWEKVPTGADEGLLGDRLDRSLTYTSLPGIANQVVSFANIPFIFYNAFSPDGDGKNDTWQIQNIEMYPDNTISIFNRWGDEVFKTKGYSASNSWNGANLQPGTYFYVLSVNENGSKRTYKGFITMVKKN